MGRRKQRRPKKAPQPEVVVEEATSSTEVTQTVSLEDRFLSKRWLLVGLLLIAALALRVIQIEVRPLHSDEGVNFHFIEEIQRRGYYPYSHENYHGPFLFYVGLATVSLLGDSILSFRLSSIVAGLLLCCAPLLLSWSRWRLLPLFWISLLALSPSMVFHSRYMIHEMWFCLGGCLLGIGLCRWLIEERSSGLAIAVGGVGLQVVNKETFIITVFAAGIATLFTRRPRDLLRLFQRDWAVLLWSMVGVVAGVFLIFSAGGTWYGGLREMFLAVPQWVGRGHSDVGHFKPFWDYARILRITEPLTWVAVLGPLSLLALLFRTPRFPTGAGDSVRFLRFWSWWGLAIFLVYSIVKYKTPWLIINLTLPAIALIAALFHLALRHKRSLEGLVMFVWVAAILASLGFTRLYNFKTPYGPKNPYSYVHTSPGFLELVGDIEEHWNLHPDAKVLIGVNAYWPLPYYLREKKSQLGYINTGPLDSIDGYKQEYDIIIAERERVVDWQGWERRYYRLSDVEESQTYYRQEY